MRGISSLLALSFVATALTGCATNMSPTGQLLTTEGIQRRMSDAMAQIKSAASPYSNAQVIMTFDGIRAFTTSDGKLTELFSDLSLTRNSNDNRKVLDVMSGIGATLATNSDLQAYIYIPKGLERDPLIRDCFTAIERTAGAMRVTIKTDQRLSRSVKGLVWVADPTLAMAPDALVSAEKHGLATRVQ